MSPFFQRLPDDYGRLTQTRPYGDVLRADGVTDAAFFPSSATTGFRGGRATFGAYGRDEIELSAGPISYKGDSVTAVVLSAIALAAVLKGG